MKKMTGRERLLRVFRQQETDRMPIWLWGVDPMFKSSRPSWEPLYEMVEKYDLEIMRCWHPRSKPRPENAPPSPAPERHQASRPDMWEYHRVMKTPKGDLTQIYWAPKDGYTWDINNTANVRMDANQANAVVEETWQYYSAIYD